MDSKLMENEQKKFAVFFRYGFIEKNIGWKWKLLNLIQCIYCCENDGIGLKKEEDGKKWQQLKVQALRFNPMN